MSNILNPLNQSQETSGNKQFDAKELFLGNKGEKGVTNTLPISSQKFSYLKHKIILNLVTATILIVSIAMVFFYYKAALEDGEYRVNLLNQQIADLSGKSTHLESRIRDAKKYRSLWDKSDDTKKNFGIIKADDVNDNFAKLATSHHITGQTIAMSIPKVLSDGIYNLQILKVSMINGSISFDSLTDVDAINFINDFFQTLSGYTVISDLSISRGKQDSYSYSDLVDISTGKIGGSTKVKLDFSWYFLNKKDPNDSNSKAVKPSAHK